MNITPVPGLPPGYSVERIWQDGTLNVRISHQGQLLREETLSPQDWLDEADGDLALATGMVGGIAAHFAYNCAAAHHRVRQVLGEDGLRDEITGIALRYRHDAHANRLEIHYSRHDKLLFGKNYSMPDLYMPHAFREDPELLWLLTDIREDFYELVARNKGEHVIRNTLNVELPEGYAAFTNYYRYDRAVIVQTHWQGAWLATALMEVEIQSFNPADDPEVETAYANAREFARRCAVIHATIREQLGDDGLHDAQRGMVLSWCYRAAEDDGDRLEIEVHRGAELLLLKNYPLPPAVHDFDAGREDVAALTRTALQPALNDWWRLCGGDTAFPGTFAAVMRTVTLPNLDDDAWHLGPASRQCLPEFVYRLLLQPGGVRGIHAVPWPGVPGEACLLFFGEMCERRLYLHLNGSNAWEKCRDNPQSWEACISDAREKNGLLQVFAKAFQLEQQDSKDDASSGVLRYRRRENVS